MNAGYQRGVAFQLQSCDCMPVPCERMPLLKKGFIKANQSSCNRSVPSLVASLRSEKAGPMSPDRAIQVIRHGTPLQPQGLDTPWSSRTIGSNRACGLVGRVRPGCPSRTEHLGKSQGILDRGA